MGELIAAFCKRLGAFPGLAPVELGAEVSRDAVDYEKADVLLLDCDGDLVAEDVFLSFDIVDVCALNAGE